MLPVAIIAGRRQATQGAEELMIVSGGDSAGPYSKRGVVNGKKYYNSVGQLNSTDHSAISWGVARADAYSIINGDGAEAYYTLSSVATPDLAGTDKMVMVRQDVVYTRRGFTILGKPYYNKLGEADSEGFNAIVYAGDLVTQQWQVLDETNSIIDSSDDDTVTPDLATGFTRSVDNLAWIAANGEPAAAVSVAAA